MGTLSDSYTLYPIPYTQVTAGFDVTAVDANLSELSKRLANKRDLPKFEPAVLTLEMLVAEGERLENEQEMVMTHNLSKEYFRISGDDSVSAGGGGRREECRKRGEKDELKKGMNSRVHVKWLYIKGVAFALLSLS